MRFDDEVLGWITEALKASRSEQRRAHEEALCRLRTEYDGLEAEMDAVYEDKILRRISVELYDRKSGEILAEQSRCLQSIEHLQNCQKSYLDEGVRILELATNAQHTFESQDAVGKGIC